MRNHWAYPVIVGIIAGILILFLVTLFTVDSPDEEITSSVVLDFTKASGTGPVYHIDPLEESDAVDNLITGG